MVRTTGQQVADSSREAMRRELLRMIVKNEERRRDERKASDK